MSLIQKVITAPNVVGYFNEKQRTVDATIGEKVFPAKKQLGLKLAFIKGAAGKPVVLQPAAFDTKVPLRERMAVELNEEEMPFFKEAMLVKEADRQQLNMIAQTGNQGMIDTVTRGIFDDTATLLAGANARLEAMRMQVLATGKIAINSNGVAKDIDYGVQEDHKGAVDKAKKWALLDESNPLADIEKAIEALDALGGSAEVMYLNQVTFAQAKNAVSTAKAIKPLVQDGAKVTKADFISYLEDNYNLKVVIKNQTYKDVDGTVKKYFPDGAVTFAPNTALGNTVFGTTPEESDLMSGGNAAVQVQLVGAGIAVTTKKLDDPVNVETKVSMIALPSFEQIDEVYMLDVDPA